MKSKKKLMVVAGAGASVEFGISSVNVIDGLFDLWSNEVLKIPKLNCSMYSYLKQEIEQYYSTGTLRKKNTNFEEILYTAINLYSLRSDYRNNPSGAFILNKVLPEILYFDEVKAPSNHDFKFLVSYLTDKLLKHIRSECIESAIKKRDELIKLKTFLTSLEDEFDLGILTFNYDNLILSQLSNPNTGFDNNGNFNPLQILDSKEWNFMYQIHGSVHFDMRAADNRLHEIYFNSDINSVFSSNSSGRNTIRTIEERPILNSNIITGYGKSDQIQRNPFYLYMIDVCRKFYEADAFLFAGYGFGDYYINNAISESLHYNRNRPVAVLTYSNDDEDPMQFRNDRWSYDLLGTIPTNPYNMSSRKYSCAPFISDIKANNEFELSKDSSTPLAIWHSGFLEACSQPDAVIKELTI